MRVFDGEIAFSTGSVRPPASFPFFTRQSLTAPAAINHGKGRIFDRSVGSARLASAAPLSGSGFGTGPCHPAPGRPRGNRGKEEEEEGRVRVPDMRGDRSVAVPEASPERRENQDGSIEKQPKKRRNRWDVNNVLIKK